MLPLLGRLLQRLEPREGWPPLLLTLIAALCLPAALIESPSGAAGSRLLVIAALSVLAGMWLARSRLRASAATIVAALGGTAITLASAAHLLPPLGVSWQGPRAAAAYTWQQVELFGIRLWGWAHHATTGTGAAQDTIALEIALSLLVWAAGLSITWHIYRHHSGWRAVTPGAIAVTAVAFLLGGLTLFYFYVYLFSAFCLVAICRLWRHRTRWEKNRTDYPDSLDADLTIALAPWLLGVLALAIVWPVLRLDSVQAAFWRQMEGPWARVESVAERLVGPIESDYHVPGRTDGRGSAAGGSLPQSHLLGSSPDLDQTVVFSVATNDPPPPEADGSAPLDHPRRYWRQATFATYTGLGWTNAESREENLSPGQALTRDLPPGTDLVQQFELSAAGTQLYAANAPYRFDTSIVVHRRAPGDLIDIQGRADHYAVVSRVPGPTVDDLRESAMLSATIPASLAARYLALPPALPARVVALAHEVVGDAPTRYDAVHRLERYLRTYPYELDLPEPPDDRDLVDYFLFDLQRGYCDYYASALVVMARGVGVPARLATGYAQGSYDAQAHRWVVTAEDGHSWAEVYFDGTGWIEFEPTAGQAALDRPGSTLAGEEIPSLPPRPGQWWQRLPWGLAIVGAGVLVLIALIAWLWHPRQASAGAGLIQDRYTRLLAWGTRLHHPLHGGQTPHEYAGSLNQALHARGSKALWPRARRAAAEAPADVERVIEAFVETRYSAHPTPQQTTWRIHAVWQRLRGHLLSLWITRSKR